VGIKRERRQLMKTIERELAIQMLYLLLMRSGDLQEGEEETREAIYTYYARQIGPMLLIEKERSDDY
jgi:hypothetical protein